jgi:hypothetical protein
MRSRNRRSLIRACGFLVVGMLLAVAKPCAAQFQVAQQYPAALYPQVVAIGDFNNDGKPRRGINRERPFALLGRNRQEIRSTEGTAHARERFAGDDSGLGK